MDREKPIDTGSSVEGTNPGHNKPKTSRKNPRRAKLVTERPLPSSALSETNDAEPNLAMPQINGQGPEREKLRGEGKKSAFTKSGTDKLKPSQPKP